MTLLMIDVVPCTAGTIASFGSSNLVWNGLAVCSTASTSFTYSSNAPSYRCEIVSPTPVSIYGCAAHLRDVRHDNDLKRIAIRLERLVQVLRLRLRAHSPAYAISLLEEGLDDVQRDISVRAYRAISEDAQIRGKSREKDAPLTRTSALVFGATAGMLGKIERG
jgi:hypothetical protein